MRLILPLLGPDEIHRGAGLPLPAEYCVDAQRFEVEVGVAEAENFPAIAWIDGIPPLLRVVGQLATIDSVTGELECARLGEFFELEVIADGYKGLQVHLDRHLRREDVVHAR